MYTINAAEPIPLYPDFIRDPRYTADGMPFITAIQDVCRYYLGKKDENKTVSQDPEFAAVDLPAADQRRWRDRDPGLRQITKGRWRIFATVLLAPGRKKMYNDKKAKIFPMLCKQYVSFSEVHP